jgi:hypothetical protein
MKIENLAENINTSSISGLWDENTASQYNMLISHGFGETFAGMFAKFEISEVRLMWWERQDPKLLERAAQKIKDHGANPRNLFGGSLVSNCKGATRKALESLSDEECLALTAWTIKEIDDFQ